MRGETGKRGEINKTHADLGELDDELLLLLLELRNCLLGNLDLAFDIYDIHLLLL